MARQSKVKARAQKRAELERQRKAEERKRLIRNWVVGAGIAVGLVLFTIAIWPASDVGNTTAEAWDLPQLDGPDRLALSDFRGKPTVAAFFASWCEVCEEEIPELMVFSREMSDDINFVGINSQDNSRGMGDATKWGIAGLWPLARDIGNGNGSALSVQTFGARGMPMNVLYSPDGEVLLVRPGRLFPQEILQTFAPYLES